MPSTVTRSLRAAVAALGVAALTTAPAWAAITIVFDEVGGHVMGSFSGSIHSTGFDLDATDGLHVAIGPNADFLGFGSGAADVCVNPSFSPIAHGSGSSTLADSSSGGGLLFRFDCRTTTPSPSLPRQPCQSPAHRA